MRSAVLLVLLLSLVGCSPDPAPLSTTSSLPATPPTAEMAAELPSTTTDVAPITSAAPPVSELLIPAVLEEFELGTVALDGVELQVAIADDSRKRQQGLMRVPDLLSLDGMLFVFAEDVYVTFWMKNTLIPLDIAFFTADGEYVDGFTMEPCRADPCPAYRASGAYRYALEMAAGDMPDKPRQLDL